MKHLVVEILYWLRYSRNCYLITVIETLLPVKGLKRAITDAYKPYLTWFDKNIDAILDWRNDYNTSFTEHGQHWHTYFDWSEGRMITSREEAQAITRRTGRERVTVADWKVESARQKRFIEEEHERIIEKKVQGVMRDVAQGRKFTHESRAKRERIMKENGMTRLPV